MQQTVFAVVAQAVNYRDHDRILTLVTRERGTVTATARGCRKPQSKLMSCAQPLSTVNTSWRRQKADGT